MWGLQASVVLAGVPERPHGGSVRCHLRIGFVALVAGALGGVGCAARRPATASAPPGPSLTLRAGTVVGFLMVESAAYGIRRGASAPQKAAGPWVATRALVEVERVRPDRAAQVRICKLKTTRRNKQEHHEFELCRGTLAAGTLAPETGGCFVSPHLAEFRVTLIGAAEPSSRSVELPFPTRIEARGRVLRVVPAAISLAPKWKGVRRDAGVTCDWFESSAAGAPMRVGVAKDSVVMRRSAVQRGCFERERGLWRHGTTVISTLVSEPNQPEDTATVDFQVSWGRLPPDVVPTLWPFCLRGAAAASPAAPAPSPEPAPLGPPR